MANYSPIYSSVWDDPDLEGETFEVHAFFVFLWSNRRIRPSGIYRATDAQLAADSGLPVGKVRAYLGILQHRCRIVREEGWVFVRGYLARQPNHDRMLSAVRADLSECTSIAVLEAFSQRYPLRRQWSADRLATVRQRMNENASPEQSSSEQSSSRAEQFQSSSSIKNTTTTGASPSASWPDVEVFVSLYNAETPDECPAAQSPIRGARLLRIRQALRQFPEEAWWREVFAQVHRSAFLRGHVRHREGSGKAFVADLNWLLGKGRDGIENAVKVYEGKYRDG